jgi:hypothetical protein
MTKSPEMEKALSGIAETLFGRKRVVGECVVCGKSVDVNKDFRDRLSQQEYKISFMCQDCQDSVYGA